MKKISLLMMAVLVLACSFRAYAANDERISEREARALSRQYLYALSGMNEEECQAYEIAEISRQVLDAGEPVWLVRMIGDSNDRRYAYNTYTLNIHRTTGECVGMDFPAMKNPVTVAFNQLQKEQHHGDLFVRWTIQEKYDFKQKFSRLYEEFLLNPPAGKYIAIDEHTLRLIQTDFRLPDEVCISQDEATAFAQSALLAAGEATEEELRGRYVYAASFLYSDAINQRGQLVWKIFFIPAPPVSPDYGYYVEVDAYTGEALGFAHQIQGEENPWACVYE